MDDIAKGVARQAAPWKATQTWWVVVIEGIVALLIGIYVVAFPIESSDIIRLLIAIALLVASLGQIVEAFRFRERPVSPWLMLGGGVGITAAALTLLSEWSFYIQPAGARQMLGVGLVAYGVIGLISLIFTFRSADVRVAAIILDLLAIGLGVLLLLAEANDTRGTQLLGAVAIIGGVALLIYSYILWSRGRTAAP
jgi:uncharacterized membrane protein HdeD (DUF308 family)